MQKTLIFLLIIMIFGCQNNSLPETDKKFVQLYAELSLLYEKEKIVSKDSDSLYQTKVQEFFKTKNITEDEFRKKSMELMKDYKAYQKFLQEVTRTVDSLKAVGN